MLRRLSSAALLIAGVSVMAPAAGAQSFSGSGCGQDTGGFLICGVWSGVISGNSVMLSITNTGNLAPANNANSAWTTVDIGGISGNYTLSGSSSTTGVPAGWTFGTGDSGPGSVHPTIPGLNDNIFGASTNGQPSTSGLRPGGPYVFNFVFTSALNASDFTNAQIGIFDQGTPAGDCGASSKAVFAVNGTGQAAFSGATCGGPPPTTVPEPSSLALLGTGLFGLVPMIRRRRRAA